MPVLVEGMEENVLASQAFRQERESRPWIS